MGRKLARGLSSQRKVDIYYNGGVDDEGAEYEHYRVSVTLATSAERIQLQAHQVEAMITATEIIEGANEARGLDASKSIAEAEAESQIKQGVAIFKKQHAYLSKNQHPPAEQFSREVMARHITQIEIVTGGDDGESVDEAVFLIGGEEKSWNEMDSAQRLDLVNLHVTMFKKLIPVIVPEAEKGVLGKSEMQRVTARAEAGLPNAPTSLTRS